MSAPQHKSSELVSRGLEHYGEGRLREAIGEWERALALTPDHEEAREYLTYVRENYDALKSEYDENGRLTLGDFEPRAGSKNVHRAETAKVDVQVDVDDGWSFDDDESPFSFTEPTKRLRLPTEPESSRATMEMGSGMLGELTGMGLAQPGDGASEADNEPLLDLAPPGSELGAAASNAEPEPDSPFDGLELATSEMPGTYDRAEALSAERSDQEVTVQRRIPVDFGDIGLAGDDEAEPETVQRRNPIDFPAAAALFTTGSAAGEFELRDGDATAELKLPDDEATREVRLPDGEATAEVKLPNTLELQEPEEPLADPPPKFLAEPPPTLNIRPPSETSPRAETTELPPLDGGDRPTTEVALRAADGSTLTPMEAMRMDVSAAADQGAADDESPADRIRRRVTRLIERAISENQQGRGQLAVVAANLALDEAPSSVVAQKLLHGHKDELQAVFAGYLGSLEQVPVLARPLTELGSGIDSRDAFLLTQVDGLLSLSDIVDVSGMPALDAHRLLCRLLIDGIILLG